MAKTSNENPIVSFVLATFFISYVVGIIIAIILGAVEKRLGLHDQPFSNVIVKYGPSLAGFITAYAIYGKERLKNLLKKGMQLNGKFSLTALAVFGPPLMLFLPAHLAGLHKSGDVASLSWLWLFGQFLLSRLFLGGGFGEEFGWRGFMLPEMNKKYSLFWSTLVVGVVWTLWHVPAYFLSNKGQEDPLLPFAVQVVAFSFLFSWFYLKSGESVLIVALLHASFNASMGLIAEVYRPDLQSPAYMVFNWIFASEVVLIAFLIWFGWMRKAPKGAG